MPILFALGLLTLLGFMSFATYRTGQLLKEWEPEENLLLLPTENVVRLGLIAVSVGLGFLSGVGPETLGWIPADPIGDIFLGVGVGVAVSLILFFPSQWVRRRRPQLYSDVVMRSIRPRSRSQWPWVILALIPVAVLEELLFRSLLLGGFSPYVNVLFFAIAASIFFGLLHLPQGEWGVVAVTLVGLAFSALFLWRGSLLLVVVAHWVANILQLIQAEWFASRDQSEMQGAD
ncbi:MAG: CPBP family intramembrane metalloprotease [Chloroflexi bacterium]|nr:CPBP family intramembrane metalloprotease [Chloroflexota bacterium]